MTTTEDVVAADPRSAVLVGVWASGARCMLQYVVAPVLGAFGVWLPWFGLTLQLAGCAVTLVGAVQLRRDGDRRWPVWAVFGVGVLGSTVLAVTSVLG